MYGLYLIKNHSNKIDRKIEKGYSVNKWRQKRYSILNMNVKATLKRLNFNSNGNDDLILDAQSSEILNHRL